MTSEPAAVPGEGDLAPDFTLPQADGDPITLSSLRGRRVILYFYPKAETPGCTAEACDFRDSFAPLTAAGYTVIGVSRDDVDDLVAFAAHHELPFPLLSDPDAAVHRAYGAWGEKVSYGRHLTGVIRSTFVIDAEGTIEHALRNVRASGHVGRLRGLLGLAG